MGLAQFWTMRTNPITASDAETMHPADRRERSAKETLGWVCGTIVLGKDRVNLVLDPGMNLETECNNLDQKKFKTNTPGRTKKKGGRRITHLVEYFWVVNERRRVGKTYKPLHV